MAAGSIFAESPMSGGVNLSLTHIGASKQFGFHVDFAELRDTAT
jgi:hypothetical protein